MILIRLSDGNRKSGDSTLPPTLVAIPHDFYLKRVEIKQWKIILYDLTFSDIEKDSLQTFLSIYTKLKREHFKNTYFLKRIQCSNHNVI